MGLIYNTDLEADPPRERYIKPYLNCIEKQNQEFVMQINKRKNALRNAYETPAEEEGETKHSETKLQSIPSTRKLVARQDFNPESLKQRAQDIYL
jgi:hypothetical protein